MKAWRVYGIGDMRLDEIPSPEVRPGWVVLKVRVLQPSITEVEELQGKAVGAAKDFEAMIKEKGPLQLFGHEFCGKVVEVREAVENVKLGDRVFYHRGVPCRNCSLCRAGYEEYCHTFVPIGKEIPGCLAEYVALPARAIASIPDSISDNEAAAMQPLVSVVGSVSAVKIKMGDTVAVLGQGVMGLNCMQVSRVCGAGKVIGIDVRDESLAVSSKLGADIVINARKTDPVEAVLKITDGVGADVVFECAGGSPGQGLSGLRTLNQALSMVSTGGKIMQLAFLSPEATLPISAVDKKGIHYMGRKHSPPRLVRYTIDLVASKRVQLMPYITHVLEGLDKVPQAFEITGNKAKYGAVNPAQVVVAR